MPIRYTHTNLVARDWQRLAAFYEQVFACTPVPPQRDHSGEWLDRITGLPKARIRGQHLRLPGHGDGGPTLEVFQYDGMPAHPQVRPNTPGYSHIAFAVDDVPATVAAVLAHSGSTVGELVERDVPGVGRLTVQYVADPEGNIIEVQRWQPTPVPQASQPT